jgi:hypothetical protein
VYFTKINSQWTHVCLGCSLVPEERLAEEHDLETARSTKHEQKRLRLLGVDLESLLLPHYLLFKTHKTRGRSDMILFSMNVLKTQNRTTMRGEGV